MSRETVREPAREIPVIAEAEVLVCGGGPAGTAAAIAAARAGAEVILVERYGCLGGLATGGLVIVIPPLTRDGRQVIGGIGQEILQQLLDAGQAEYRNERGSSLFDPEALKRLSDQMCLDAGVRLRFHSWVVGVFGDGGRPEGVVVESKAGRQAIRARLIIDCTGDGDVAALAGGSFERDDRMIGLPFRIGSVDIDRWLAERRPGAGGTRGVHEAARAAGGYESHFGLSPISTERGVVWANNHMTRGNFLDPAILTRMEIRGRRAAHRVLSLLRERMPGFEEAWLIDTAWQIGVRCTRRIEGRHCMSFADFQAQRHYPDTVALGNDFRDPDLVYEIPLRSLLPADLDNVAVAGRCASADAQATEPLREIHCCWTMGEAAGAAAALAVERDCVLPDVPVQELQVRLRDAGAVIDIPPRP
ncbi:MAG: FAD-dependent oxidoreductase [Armatimonadota bacterium]|nr:FAD-dependent oxidoreductase [Armatimonadota bacterium]